MEKPLFASAKLKVKRANHHIRELVLLFNTFFHPDRDRVRFQEKVDTSGKKHVTMKVSNKDMEDIPLIVGDAVHNLRTALDHVAHELVLLSGGKRTYHTKFTLRKTRKEVVTAIGGEIQGIGLDMVTRIIEYIQPYRGGNDALWTLHTLDIADKHHLILPVWTSVGIAFHVTDGSDNVTSFILGPIREEEPRAIGTTPSPKIEDYGNPVMQILFEDIEGLRGQSVIPTLHHLQRAVSATIEDIERAFLDIREQRARPLGGRHC